MLDRGKIFTENRFLPSKRPLLVWVMPGSTILRFSYPVFIPATQLTRSRCGSSALSRGKSSELQLPVPKGGLTPRHGYFPLSSPQDENDSSRLAEVKKKKKKKILEEGHTSGS